MLWIIIFVIALMVLLSRMERDGLDLDRQITKLSKHTTLNGIECPPRRSYSWTIYHSGKDV